MIGSNEAFHTMEYSDKASFPDVNRRAVMTTTMENKISFIQDLERSIQELSQKSPSWINDLRQEALSFINENGFPTTKDEEWKYTNVSPILSRQYRLASSFKAKASSQTEAYRGIDAITLTFMNGVFSPECSNLKNIPAGVQISTLSEALKNPQDEKFLQEKLSRYSFNAFSSFAALNQLLLEDGIYIKIAEKAIVTPLIQIINMTDPGAENLLTSPRTFIHLGKLSEATIFETHLSVADGVYFTNALTDIILEENATIHYCNAQNENHQAYHIGTTRVWQERNSNFNGFILSTGGLIIRNDLDVILNGEGCNSGLNGLYTPQDKQLIDNHTFVDHRFPNCVSNQLYKGLLQGESHAVFNGKICVRSIAQQTNSYQLNKNLILGTDCRVDTKPQLEIFADDVKCTHGATIGQLNQEEIFYLQTRGVPRRKATRMLAQGFVDEIVETVKNETIQKHLSQFLKPVLEKL
ncbi:MAG: Fe-S cluster assembly protein SufD [Candidatus Omnitrophica bacterium]|nr:Fe-S cluster assembly protein SufD [Candidatus Omnitrophota bacterium]